MIGWQLSWADKGLQEDQRCHFTLLRSKTTISDNALVKSRTNSFRLTLLWKERDLTLCACQLKGKHFWRSAIEVKDEQSPLSIKTEYGREVAYNATTWTERSNPSWHARFGLVGTAAMHDVHVIQGPNVTRDAREKIAFFTFHALVVEESRFQQNRVRAKLYNCGACVCKSNVEILGNLLFVFSFLYHCKLCYIKLYLFCK